jgi:peptidyl-prolyl cis-trans isomerase C
MQAMSREPLVHFLLAGLMLFAFFSLRGEPVDAESRTITLSEQQVGQLATNWAQTWQRPPTQPELDGLIRDYIKEEIYYREGLRLGLDQDDPIVRRRIGSKMQFLISSQLESERPSDATLQALLDRNPQRYAEQARYSFDQIYIGPPDDPTSRDRAAQWLAALGEGADWRKMGESLSRPRSIDNIGRDRLAADFGEEFAAGLKGLKVGEWSDPIISGFGLHLVRVRHVQISGKPDLIDVRQAVENDWRSKTARDREATAYQTLLDSYTIKIAKP